MKNVGELIQHVGFFMAILLVAGGAVCGGCISAALGGLWLLGSIIGILISLIPAVLVTLVFYGFGQMVDDVAAIKALLKPGTAKTNTPSTIDILPEL